jgi:nicotinamide-nucleotide amidase
MSDIQFTRAVSPHTCAAILSIGDELVRGQVLDTNAKWLAARLLDLGIEPVELATIPDDRQLHASTLARLAQRAPLIISTGGLGPTDDDLTREALIDATGDELVVDVNALADLEAKFKARGRAMNDMQRRQALRPSRGVCIQNPLGTAPGLHAQVQSASMTTDVYCLPGPPGELQPMFLGQVVPRLRPVSDVTVAVRVISMIGIGEADAAKRLPTMMARDRNPLVGITASGAIVSWRLRARTRDGADAAQRLLDADEQSIRAAMERYIFAVGNGETSLAASVVERLRARGQTLGVVESCTGGMLGQMLTDVAGVSSVFRGGITPYSNDVKTGLVGAQPETIAAFGAVSPGVARQLALGGRARLRVDHAVAITGIAGPGGGSESKPVGTVYIAHAYPRARQPSAADAACDVRCFMIPGSRNDVRERAARLALAMVHLWLGAPLAPEETDPALLFEVLAQRDVADR